MNYMKSRSVSKKKPNRILETVHDSAVSLHRAGLINAKTMAEFDALCLPPVNEYTPAQIKKLRKRFNISQPVLAAYLNTSPNTVKQWEQGVRKPNSVAMKLLDVIDHLGLQVLVYEK